MTRLTQAMAMAMLACLGLPAAALDVGSLAPKFELQGPQANVNLSDYRGQTVYLDFWASWCGPCSQSFPWMNAMQTRYGAKGLRVVAIGVDQKLADAQAFLRRTPANFDVAFDPTGQTPKSYAIASMPTSVLIGPDGKVLFMHGGFSVDQQQLLEQHIRNALGL